jgi:hypothetical protein
MYTAQERADGHEVLLLLSLCEITQLRTLGLEHCAGILHTFMMLPADADNYVQKSPSPACPEISFGALRLPQ